VIQGRCSINIGEALAMLEAIKELSQRGFTNVHFSSKQILGKLWMQSAICIIQKMLFFNTDFEVKSIKRQANMFTHMIARAAIS
jgi:hypothetical protein